MQLYAIKTVVEIDRVKLNIRFPGTLSFQFKNNQIYEDLPKLYPLANGECTVGESVALEVQGVYNSREDSFAELTVDLIVSINTVSGKIAAGTITFNAIQNKTLTLPLKRCSDKTAEATLSIGFAKIRKIRDLEEEPMAVKQKSQSRLLAQARSKEKRSFEDIRQPSSILQTERRQNAERNQSKDSPGALMSSKVVRPVLLGMGISADSRMKEMEENYQRKLRQVNRQKEEMEGQLESIRQKWKMSERREKEMQTALKDTREQSDKRRIKISDLQGKLAESQKIVLQYEKRAKTTQQQAKLAAQRLQQATTKYQLLQKKLQGRQQSSGDRQRRLGEKLSQLQGQHSRTVHEYNLLLQKMEVQEKANQTIFKNKERSHLEERAKWKEASEKYERAQKKLQQEYDELNAKYSSLVNAENTLRLKFADLQANFDLLKTADENRRLQMEREEAIKKELQRELQALRILEGDKAVLKKKINESNQEQLRSKQRADKLFLQNEELKQSLKNAEKSIQQYKRDKKSASTRMAELQRTVSQNQRELTRLSAQNNSLSSKNTYLNQRLNDLKTKSDQQSSTHSEQESQLQARISSILQSKQYLQADIEDLKWTLEKSEESIADCERKLKDKSEDIFRLQEETMKLQKEREDLTQELQEKEIVNLGLRGELAQGKRREQQGQDALKQRDRKIYDQQKRISQLEQQNFMASSKLTGNLQDYRDTLANKDSTIQQLTDQIIAKQTKITELQNSLEKLEEESQDQAREIKLLTLSLDQADRNLKLEKETSAQLKKNNEILKRQLGQAQSKLSSEEQDSLQRIQSLTSAKTSLEKQLQTRQSEAQGYKRSVQQLLMIISKDEQMPKMEEVIAVPDSALAKNQLQALLSRNKYLSTFRSNINELKVEISYLQKEVETKTSALASKNQELETAVKKHSQRVGELEGEWQRSAQEYADKIEALESALAQLRSQKEKLQNKHKGLQEAFDQQRASKEELQQHLGIVKEELKTQEQLNLQLRSRQISKKGEDESFIHNLKVELKSQLDKLQETIAAQQREIETNLKTIADREKSIAGLKGELASLQQEKSKTETTLQETQEKYSKLTEDKAITDQVLQQAQKKIINLKEDLEKAHGETASERELKNTLQEKLKQSHEHASQLMVDKQNLQSRLDSIQKSSSFSQEEQRSRIAQLEQSLQAQAKKAAKYFNDLTERNGELQLKKFLTQQLEQKLADLQNTAGDLRKEIQEKRNTINRLSAAIQDQNRVLMAAEKEKSDVSQEKSAAQDEISIKKERIAQLETDLKEMAGKLEKTRHELEDSRGKEDQLRKEQATLQSTLAQLRDNLNESRKQAQRLSARQSEGKTKISLLQEQLREKEEFYQNHKSKNWEENQREVSGLREKTRQLESKLDTLMVEREEERENLRGEIEYVSNSNQELQALLEQKEAIIEQQQAELLQAQGRIISLNGQLRNCLQAWQKEKAASLPSRRQTAKIEDDIGKFQAYAADLDRKAKQMLNNAVLRARDEMMAKISQTVVELLELIHKAKSRAVSRASDIDREELSKEYDRIREKAEELLRANRAVAG